MSHLETTAAFSELLNPVKDPEKSFSINISELLQDYVKNFVLGSVNFNSAALLIQGSSSIYGKKVEYLHNLATKLYASLVKHKKEDGVKKDSKEKEKPKKEAKFTDPFCSTEIKMGKNLSCLRKKYAAKSATNKKTAKKSDKKYTFVPIDLLPLDDNEKGMEIFDVEGKSIGKKLEFTLNKCKVTASGWLLLPAVSPDLIPTEFSTPDYSYEDEVLDDNVCDDMIDSSPMDEGYPPSSGNTETPSSVPCSQDPSSVPSSQGTDEGIGSLPCTPLEGEFEPGTSTEPVSNVENVTTPEIPMEGVLETPDGLNHGLEGIENIPLDDAGVAPRPRRSMRNALKLCQLQEDGAPNQLAENTSTVSEKEAVVVKKAIQKKNTFNLPSKLKANDAIALYPASEFCARTFFSMDRMYSKSLNKNELLTTAFRNNGTLFAKFLKIQGELYDKKKEKEAQKKAVEESNDDDDDEEIDADGIEDTCDDPCMNDDIATPPLEAADIVIQNNAVLPVPASDNENPLVEDEPMFGENPDDELSAYNDRELEDSFSNAARLQMDLFREDFQQYVQTSDISKRVHAWEATMKPFLDNLNRREEFDINQYGSRILNSFEDNNRKQTITFRNFCKGKEKWEIHRYFMALLPLVNIGNVSIEEKKLEDGGDDILVTLLSRKMHHKELEEFGHKEGEH